MKPEGSIIYFIQAGLGPVKIGFSTVFGSRMSTLQVAHYEELHLRAVIENATEALESEIHTLFYASHIRGEWFYPTMDLREFMRLNCWPRKERPLVVNSGPKVFAPRLTQDEIPF